MALDQIGISVELRAELDRFNKNMQDAGRIVEAAGGQMDRSTKRAADSFARLESALSPASKAAQLYERDTLRVQMAVDKGAVSTDRAAKVQEQLNNQYEATIARLSRVSGAQTSLNQTTTQASGGARNMGFAFQQAGYQIGDFAVQVASGQGVLRPFIQQGTQLVSMFGPWGAVIGAAGAVLGALYTALWQTKDAAGAAGDALTVLADATANLNDEVEKGTNLSRSATIDLLNSAEATKARAQEELRLAEAILQRYSAELKAAQGTGYIGGVTRPPGAVEIDVQAARTRLEESQGALDQVSTNIQQLRDRLNGLGSEYSKTAADNDRLIAAMQVSQHEYDVTAKTIEILKGGFAGTEEQARALAETLVGQKEKLDGLTKSTSEAEKQSDKYTKQIAKERDAFAEYLAQLDLKNEALKNEITGHQELNPLLEAEAALSQSMGRELLPQEVEQLKKRVEQNQKLTSELKAHNELEKEAQKQADQVSKVWERAGENIQKSLADAIFSGKNGFESLKNVALDVAKQIAAAMIFNPIIQPIIGTASSLGGSGSLGGLVSGGSGGSIFSSLGSAYSLLNTSAGTLGNAFVQSGIGQSLGLSTGAISGIGPANVSGLGSSIAGIGNVLGAGGIGYGVGSLISGLGIGNSTGSSIGGALGGAVGSIIPGVGTIIGSIAGSLIGGLFGNSQPSNLFARQNIDLSSGTLGRLDYNPREYSQQNVDAATKGAQAFLDLEKQIIGLTGGSTSVSASLEVGSRDGIYAMVGNQGKRFANSDAGFEQALDFMVKALADNITDVTNEAFDKALHTGSTGEEVLQNLQFVSDFINLTSETANPLGDALDAVNKQFDDMIPKVKELGLSEAALEEARQKQLAATEYQLTSGVYSNVYNAANQIDSFLNSQSISADSSLNPTQRLQAAQAQFDKALNDVRGGDLSQVSSLTNAANSLLSVGRTNYASSLDFSNLENSVRSSLASVGQTITSQQFIGDQITQALQNSSTINAQKLDQVKASIDALRRDMQLYTDKLAA